MKRWAGFLMLLGMVPLSAQGWAQKAGMVLIPEGAFVMGSNAASDESAHTVFLSAYYIDTHEVTQTEFETVMGSNPSDFSGPKLPVEQVTWFEARDFCKALGKRLPTEAEWEKAARGGTATPYYWGQAIDGTHAWYWDNSKRSSHPVGGKSPNAFGLYDMSGNVWEWVQDHYGDKYYEISPAKNPQGPFQGKYRVIRGGSWRDLPEVLRVSRRNYDLPVGRFNHIGFRCAKSEK